VDREFLGRGWSFPLRPRADRGGIQLSEAEQNIEESIHLILNTVPGERPMLPEFGCGLRKLIFDTNSARTRSEAERMVQVALADWEPRIGVDKVEARPDPDNPSQIRINIEYTVRKSNNHQNMVHLVHLQEFVDAY